MTANRDLKRRVRDRQAQTGESYMTALRHVLAQRPDSESSGESSPIPTIEFVDATETAAAVGLKCRISISPALAHTIDVERTLVRLRDMLTATARDPALSVMRTVALGGTYVAPGPVLTFQEIQQTARFVQRVRAGLGGVNESGRVLALRVVPRAAAPGDPPAGDPARPGAAPEAPSALFELWWAPSFPGTVRPPLLVVTSLEESVIDQVLDRFPAELP